MDFPLAPTLVDYSHHMMRDRVATGAAKCLRTEDPAAVARTRDWQQGQG